MAPTCCATAFSFFVVQLFHLNNARISWSPCSPLAIGFTLRRSLRGNAFLLKSGISSSRSFGGKTATSIRLGMGIDVCVRSPWHDASIGTAIVVKVAGYDFCYSQSCNRSIVNMILLKREERVGVGGIFYPVGRESIGVAPGAMGGSGGGKETSPSRSLQGGAQGLRGRWCALRLCGGRSERKALL